MKKYIKPLVNNETLNIQEVICASAEIKGLNQVIFDFGEDNNEAI